MKKYNCLAVAGIVLLLLLGYGIPSVVMTVADSRRKTQQKSFEIEEMQLDVQNTDIIEELGVFSDMIMNQYIVEMSDASMEMERIQTSIDTFLELFLPKEKITFVDKKANYYVMLVSKEDERAYPFWEYYGVDEDKNGYHFWIDAVTEQVLAFELPYEKIGTSDEGFYEKMDTLADYYGFDIWGMAESISNLYKTDSWQNGLKFLNVRNETEESHYLNIFKLGGHFWFNVYPGEISIYDESYTMSE